MEVKPSSAVSSVCLSILLRLQRHDRMKMLGVAATIIPTSAVIIDTLSGARCPPPLPPPQAG
jgi:hypothetical protein